MKSALQLQDAKIEAKWTVMNGPLKGALHALVINETNEMYVGRSSDCDVVIAADPKCSRKHAKVVWTPAGFEISALNANNILKVNGSNVETAILRDADLVCFGETELLFNVVRTGTVSQRREPMIRTVASRTYGAATIPAAQSGAAAGPLQPLPQMPPMPTPFQPQVGEPIPGPAPARARTAKSGGLTRRLLIYGVIIGVGIWLFTDSKKKKLEQQIRTPEKIEQDIKDANKMQQLAEEERKKHLSPSNEVRQAQENFVKGFRDFRKGQFERAIESFQACLALFPDHPLCNRYQRLAQRKFNELIQYQMVLGRQYRDQEQYRACEAAFRNVMFMIKDFGSLTYKEAKANYDACNAYVEGRF